MKEKIANSVDEKEIEHFSRIAEEWWDLQGKFKPLHTINPLRLGYIRDHACAHFGLSPDQAQPLTGLSLLDIGCGGGLLCEPMARLGASVTGIDASEKNIRVASLHAEQSALRIDYRATTAEALAATDTRFDIILAMEVIEHVADIDSFIAAASTLLKPGGIMVWSTLNRTPMSYALAIIGAEYILSWLPRGTHRWSKFVRPSELHRHLHRQHLQVTDMTGLVMNPLTFEWRLDARNLSVNYMLVAVRDAKTPSGIPLSQNR